MFGILMIMQEARYLLSGVFCSKFPNRTGAVEDFLLELRGNRIPTHDHGSSQAPQDLLFDLSERGAVVAMELPSTPRFRLASCSSALDCEIHSFRWANVAWWRGMHRLLLLGIAPR